MGQEHEIVAMVLAAQTDNAAADDLISKYMGFIKAETAKFTQRIPVEGRDDELSIAMMAFYEAVLGYERSRGSFLKLAAVSIRNRLIDYSRTEKRHAGVLSCDETTGDGDGEGTALIDRIADERDEIEETTGREATKSEIAEFAKQLADFGVSLSDVADNCPRQERTLSACYSVLGAAKMRPELLDELVRTRRLPMSELSKLSGVDRKTMDRHRKYLVAILLAYTNGYEIIRGHLSQVGRVREGAPA